MKLVAKGISRKDATPRVPLVVSTSRRELKLEHFNQCVRTDLVIWSDTQSCPVVPFKHPGVVRCTTTRAARVLRW